MTVVYCRECKRPVAPPDDGKCPLCDTPLPEPERTDRVDRRG